MKPAKIILISVISTLFVVSAAAFIVFTVWNTPKSMEQTLGYKPNQVAKIVFFNGESGLSAETENPEEIKEFLSLFRDKTLTIKESPFRPSESGDGSRFNVQLYNAAGKVISSFQCFDNEIWDDKKDQIYIMSNSLPEGALDSWKERTHISQEDRARIEEERYGTPTPE